MKNQVYQFGANFVSVTSQPPGKFLFTYLTGMLKGESYLFLSLNRMKKIGINKSAFNEENIKKCRDFFKFCEVMSDTRFILSPLSPFFQGYHKAFREIEGNTYNWEAVRDRARRAFQDTQTGVTEEIKGKNAAFSYMLKEINFLDSEGEKNL